MNAKRIIFRIKDRLKHALILLGIMLLITFNSLTVTIAQNSAFTIKNIGYSCLDYDSLLSKEYNLIDEIFSESILNSLNDLGLHYLLYSSEKVSFRSPDIEQIKKLCNQLTADVWLISKLQFDINEEFLNGNRIRYIPNGSIKISMKLINNEGKLIKNVSFSTEHVARMTLPSLNNLIPEAVYGVLKKLTKNLSIVESEIPIDRLKEKTWQSYKIIYKNNEYESLKEGDKVNLRLYNNSEYFLESIAEMTGKISTTTYSYDPARQELILHTKIDDLSYTILDFDENILILKPLHNEDIDKIYFRHLTEKETPEMLKSNVEVNSLSKDTIRSYSFTIDSVPEKRIPVETIEVSDEPIFFVVEESATFQGGDLNSFREWVYKHTIYPAEAEKQKMSGKAIVQFVIGTDGSIKYIKIIRTSGWEILDNEALRVLGTSPKWKPGRQGGKAVNQLFTLPVSFVSY